ncbi:MAG: hypothetical protein J6X02_03600 [Bacilli bacterium]|nr:hypothetical protein [Bacilli bacterium]
MEKRVYAAIHFVIIILELYAFSRTILLNNRMGLEYYTVLSNLLAFITSLLCLYYYKGNKYVNNLYYLTTCMLLLTFLVVLFVLAPMYNFDYYWLMFKGSNLVMHTLAPALMVNSYIIFNKEKVNKIMPLIVTTIYGVIMIILNLVKVIEGPYPFLEVYNQPVYMSIIWVVVLLLVVYIISILVVKLNRKLGDNYEY